MTPSAATRMDFAEESNVANDYASPRLDKYCMFNSVPHCTMTSGSWIVKSASMFDYSTVYFMTDSSVSK